MALPTERVHLLDPPAELAEFRTQGPLRRLAYADGHVGWLVTSFALARAVLADPRFSARQELNRPQVTVSAADVFFGRPAPPGAILSMDPPEHTRYRRLLTGHFTTRRMNQLRPRIEQIVERQLDAMEQAGPPSDLLASFALPVSMQVICELLGVPYERGAHFERATATTITLDASSAEVFAALESMLDMVREVIHHKRARPAEDLLSVLVGSGELTDDEMAELGMFLVEAGHDTSANLLALGTFALLRHPDQLEALRADPALIDNAVENLLRYITLHKFGLTRTALEDVELGGETIQAGECVTVSLPAANRDPEQFDNPEGLDLTRSVTGHVAFGHGVHMCIGQHLARIELRTGFGALLRRFPKLRLAVPADEVRARDDMLIHGLHGLPVSW